MWRPSLVARPSTAVGASAVGLPEIVVVSIYAGGGGGCPFSAPNRTEFGCARPRDLGRDLPFEVEVQPEGSGLGIGISNPFSESTARWDRVVRDARGVARGEETGLARIGGGAMPAEGRVMKEMIRIWSTDGEHDVSTGVSAARWRSRRT
jgi:hypothetical protein